MAVGTGRGHGGRRLVLGALLAAAVPAGAAVELTAVPAWGGHFRPGSTTGLEVRIVAERGGPARLRIDDGTLPQTLVVETLADTPLTARFVVTPPNDGSVIVTFSGRDGRHAIEAPFLPLALGQSIAAELGSIASPTRPGRIRVAVDPTTAPTETAAWQTLTSLTIDRPALAALQPGARRAFGDWLAACSNVIAGDLALREVLADSAGCGGRQVTAAAQGPASSPPPPPLAAQRLDALLDLPAMPLATPLLLLLGGYLAGLWLLRRAHPAWLVTVPLAGAALAAMTFDASRSTTAIAAWDEQPSGAEYARRSELWRISGGGPGHVSLPVTAGYPRRLDGTGNAELLIGSGPARLAVATELLSTSRFALNRVVAVPAAPTLGWHDGEPLVANPGVDVLDTAWLRWRGRTFHLPALPPGATWQPDTDAPGISADTPPLRLLVERAGYAALLVGEQGTRWRVIYPGGPS